MKEGLVAVAALVVFLFACLVASWGLGWVAVPFRMTSAANVQEQWRFAYDYNQKLVATAQQVCSAEKALDAATSDNEKTQRRSQLIAYEQNYSRIASDYDAALRDPLRAGIVKPADLPSQAPSLAESKRMACR